MGERIANMMSIIIVTFIIVTIAAIIRGIYIVRQKQRESKMREALYFSKMKADREKRKAEQAKEQENMKEDNALIGEEGIGKADNNSIDNNQNIASNINRLEESTEQVKKEVEFDWLTGEAIK